MQRWDPADGEIGDEACSARLARRFDNVDEGGEA